MRELGWVNTCGRDWVLFFRSLLALSGFNKEGSGQSNWETGCAAHQLLGAEQLPRDTPILGHHQGGVIPVSSASFAFLECVPDSGSCNVLESMVSQEERPGEERPRPTGNESEAGHGQGGKKEGRDMEGDGERSRRERAVSRESRASQPIKSRNGRKGREGASAQAQSWLSAELRGAQDEGWFSSRS